ncbi:MAG: type I-C CRISPR-associated protein Cas5c [Endomicrobiaceae bacterium]|nr:type I-C CRISPR-associated protein Cas5c [Endomicrobiaceae bacterium]
MQHRNIVEFKVYGQYALFSDPVTRIGGEKLSYQIPTYEALKGILHSIYWKPTIIWIIDKVRIMKSIQTHSQGIRPIKYSGGNDLSIYTYLRDVEYHVQAHFEWNENRPELINDRNENKHHNIAKRMISKGGRRDIFLGTRECQGYVETCNFEDGISFYDNIGELNFGFMLHGFTYPDEAIRKEDKGNLTVRFWKPIMKKGIIEFLRPEECAITRTIKQMDVKKFDETNFVGLKEFVEGDFINVNE